MHPVITQAIAAERTREFRAYAAVAGRSRQLRRSRRSRHVWLAAGIPGARFVALEGRNHLFLEQEPAAARFFEEIEFFLKAPS